MEEHTFFDQGDVKVTNSRFISNGQTYAMRNVTSVKPFKQNPPRVIGVVLALVGLAVMTQSFLVGLVILAIGGAILFMLKPTYHVLLATSSGETRALHSKDQSFVNQVIQAINDAIVHRP